MTKAVLMLLMIFALPFQSAWSMAAQFCQHETGTVWHWGHHIHPQHAGDQADQISASDHKPDQKKQLNHNDHIAHLDHGIELVAEPAPIIWQPKFAWASPQPPPPQYQSILLDLPKPPRWQPYAAGGAAPV